MIDQIKRYIFIGSHLDTHVSFDVKNEAARLNDIELNPFSAARVLLSFNFEEQDLTGTSRCQALVEYQIHLTKVFISHSIKQIVTRIILFNYETVSLSVESIDFFQIRVVKAFVRKILDTTRHLEFYNFTFSMHQFNVENEMVVDLSIIVEDTDKDEIICNEATYNEGIRESIDCHGPVVDIQLLIDLELAFLNYFFCPLRF